MSRSALFLLGALLLLPVGASQAQDERLYLPVDPEAETTFKRLEELGKRGQWDRVVLGLDNLMAEGGDRLLETPKGFMSVRAEARRRLMALTGQGRVAYDLIHADPSERLLEEATERGGVSLLERLLAEHPASKSVPRARTLLASRYVERGNPGAALPLIRWLLDQSPDGEQARRLERMRVVSLALSGRRGEALNALEEIEAPANVKAELMERLARVEPARPILPKAPGAKSWSRPVFGFYEVNTKGSPPWSFAAADVATTYVHDGSHAYALDLVSGRLLWCTPLRDVDAFRRPAGLCQLALSQGVVLCLLPGAGGFAALDRVTGHLLWRRTLTEVKREAGIDFEAHVPPTVSPQVIGSVAVIAIVTEHQDREVHALGVDLFSGKLSWSVFVASESGGTYPHPVLSGGGGRVFVATGHGALVALDSRGEVKWLQRYKSKRDAQKRRPRGPFWRGRRDPNADRRPPLRPPGLIVSAGTVWLAAADGADGLAVFDAESGAKRGELSAPVKYLLAPRGTGVLAYSVAGELLQVTRAGHEPIVKVGPPLAAQATVVGDTVYLPVGNGVQAVNLTSKSSKKVLDWTVSGGRGNLLVAGGRLLVAAPRGLYAFGEAAAKVDPSDLGGDSAEPSMLTLIEALGDDRFAAREVAAAGLLAKREEARPALEEASHSADPEVALRADMILGELDRVVRLTQWRPLVKAAWKDKIADLLNRLTHPNPEVRLAALRAMGAIQDDPDVVVLMSDLLEDRDSRIAFTAAGALLARESRKGVDLLTKTLLEGPEADRLQAVTLFEKHGGKQDLPALAKALGDKSPQVRAAVVGAVFKHGQAEGLDLAAHLLDDEDDSVRQAVVSSAIAHLAGTATEAYLKVLHKAALDPNDAIRGQAITEVAKIKPPTPETMTVLGAALGDSVAKTAKEAARALYSATQRKGLVLLIPPEAIEKGALSKDDVPRNYVAQIAMRYADAGGRLSSSTLARLADDRHAQIKGYRLGGRGWGSLLVAQSKASPLGVADMAAITTLTLSTDANLRLNAYQCLAETPDAPGRGELLAQGLADEHAAIRKDCAAWLAGDRSDELLDGAALRVVLRVAARSEREEGKKAARALMQSASLDVMAPATIEFLNTPAVPDDLQALALEALAERSAIPLDPEVSPASSLRRYTVWWWQRANAGLSPEQLIADMSSTNPSKRWRAAQVAATLPLREVRNGLIASLHGEDVAWVLKEKLKVLVKMTGQRQGFAEDLKPDALRACANRFRTWLGLQLAKEAREGLPR